MSLEPQNPAEIAPDEVDRMHRFWSQAFIDGAGPDTPALPAAEAFLAHACAIMRSVSGDRHLARALRNLADTLDERAAVAEAQEERSRTGSVAH